MVVVLAASIVGCMVALSAVGAHAQSPSPTAYVENIDPATAPNPPQVPSGAVGVVVEGLGLLNCNANPPSLAQVESVTVEYVNANIPTVTEISPQSACGTESQYQTLLSQIQTYVQDNSNATSLATYWKGFMLDEETGFGFTPSQIESLNSYASSLTSQLNTIAYVMGEIFSCPAGEAGCWSQGDFNSIAESTIASPQIATPAMVTFTNNFVADVGHVVAVTWSPGYSSPYNSESYDSGAVNGTPWYQWGQYLSNEFVAS